LSRFTLMLIVALLAAGGGFYLRARLDTPPTTATDPIIHHAVNTPTIEQVKKLASLVALRVPISDVQVSELAGTTGGVKLALAVYGEVDIATDMSAAKFEQVKPDEKSAVLVLHRPAPDRPRLDHEKTRILDISRSGLWAWLPGEAGEKTVTNRAMQAAQRILGEAADRKDLAAQACQQTETVVRQFFGATGWDVVVQWDDAPAGLKDGTATVPEK
jgi:hypothetical protein